MLMTVGGLAIATPLLLFSLILKKAWLARFTVAGVAVWFVFYAAMLIGFSLTSTEKVLAAGEAKEYCGFYLDCHMHTAVTGVRTAKTIGDRTANGRFCIVNVKVFSDAKNPDIKLRLLEPKARVVKADGTKIERDLAAEAFLPTASVMLDTELTNSRTIEKEIVFDMPEDAANPKLLITEGYGIDNAIERFLIGDEDSLLHARTFFEVKEETDAASFK